MEIQILINGLPLSGKEFASIQEGLISNQVNIFLSAASGIKDMHLDKQGAVSVFTAFQFVVKEKLKVNLTVSMGFV